MTGTDDERLLIEAAQADPARFAELYDRHVDRVFAYVSRRAGNRSVAEDVTSAVFEQALASLPRFEWRGIPFVAWLLLWQAEVALAALSGTDLSARDRAFYEGKVAAARFFARTVLPALAAERTVAETTDNALMELPEEAF